MKRISILLAAITIIAISGFQAKAQISAGATVGLQMPMGNFGNAFNAGFGFNAMGKYELNETMGVGLNIGVASFGSDISGFSSSMMPITGLFEYYLGTDKLKPYVGADLGLYHYKVKMEIFGIKTDISDTYLGFAPTGGVLYELSDQLNFCGNLKYHYVMSEGDAATYLGINAGIVYKIK